MFSNYVDENLKYITPMSAKDVNLLNYVVPAVEFAELKFDGHRGILHMQKEGNRAFSRFPSKTTGWHTENTLNVPHIADMCMEELEGTILDGEFDYGENSNSVQSVMGSLPERAIAFQEQHGYIPFKAFDILYYKGVNVQKLPLWKRKVLLADIIVEIYSKYGEEATWYMEYSLMYMREETREMFLNHVNPYVNGYFENEGEMMALINSSILEVNKYLDLFNEKVEEGKEGLMLKSMQGIYEQQRTKSYLKAKAEGTWDCVVMGFTKPTREYTGKELHKWKYWEAEGNLMTFSGEQEALKFSDENSVEVTPVTKPYYMGWCGAIEFGVWKPFDEDEFIQEYCDDISYGEMILNQLHDEGNLKIIDGKEFELVHVGDCKGLTEKELINIKENGENLIGEVIEVKANGILDKEKGSLRHPRFKMWRHDKPSQECTFDVHVGNLGGK